MGGGTGRTGPVPITSFSGAYRFLNNFYAAPVTLFGITYPDSEHAFHAMKTLDPAERQRIAAVPTPAEAKRLGRKLTLRENWDKIKPQVMWVVLCAKFYQHQGLARLLIDTGDARLEEGNTWGDDFWGTVDGKGENYLGRLLMELREELRDANGR